VQRHIDFGTTNPDDVPFLGQLESASHLSEAKKRPTENYGSRVRLHIML
jgi:hypothetical protein